jgi:CBS domain containing-hemolysin-like protein
MRGFITKVNAGLYDVYAEGKTYTCIARGKFRIGEYSPLVGDEVDFDDRDFDDDNTTVGGFVIELLGRYAEVGDVIDYENITFTVIEVDELRVIKLNVKVTPIEPETEE